MTPRITTPRLLLREWREDDKPIYAELNADPMVMEHFPSTLTEAQSGDMVDRLSAGWHDRGYGLWAVEVRDTATFIGFVGLSSPLWEAPFTPCVEIGWRLSRSAWGYGYAPEAARAALAWGFGELDLPNDEIVSFTTAANLKSRRVMEKLGMRHDITRDFDHPLFPDWSGRRHVLYSLVRGDFEDRSPVD